MTFTPDQILVAGLVLAVLAIPAIVSAISDARAPRVAAIVAIAAGGLMVWAINEKEGGYQMRDIPTVFYRVVGDMLN